MLEMVFMYAIHIFFLLRKMFYELNFIQNLHIRTATKNNHNKYDDDNGNDNKSNTTIIFELSLVLEDYFLCVKKIFLSNFLLFLPFYLFHATLRYMRILKK